MKPILFDNGSDCPSRKAQYPTRAAAKEVALPSMRQFRCDHCGCWHNGHRRRADKKREIRGR